MQRRDFIKKSSLTALSISAFGSIQWNGKSFVGDNATTTDILGPFYRPGAPMRSNLIPTGSKGTAVNLSGTIFKEDGKTPLADALVEIWHCDETAYYDNTSDDYTFRGALKTGKNGKYDFKTIIPVPYKAVPDNEESWRPAHFHMRVSSGIQQDLVTQIYFKGEKYVDTDDWASAPQAANRVLEITKNASNENLVKFDVVMSKEFPLEESAYKRIAGLYQLNSGEDVLEFTKNDDLLFMKWNGQLVASLKYAGNNTFDDGFRKANFELLAGGNTKVTITNGGRTYSAEKFLKYPD